MPRYFRLDQARALLPAIERHLRAAMRQKKALAEAEAAWMELRRKVSQMGGVNLQPAQVAELKRRREDGIAGLRVALDDITEEGVQVKDLDIGLIDFPTLYRGEEVLLCWRLGEPDIEYWHNLTAGFRGRQPIDDDFIARHRGDEAC